MEWTKEQQDLQDEINTVYDKVNHCMNSRYQKTLEDMEICKTKGYWRDKVPCEGYPVCKHPIHHILGNKDGTRHTYEYLDPGRDPITGQLTSRYRSWQLLSKHLQQT